MKQSRESQGELGAMKSVDPKGHEPVRARPRGSIPERSECLSRRGPSLVTSARSLDGPVRSIETPSPSAVTAPDGELDVQMRALTHMAGQIAHRFNNQLAVLGLTASHLHDQHHGESREDLKDMLEVCGRGAELTSKLLRISGGHWSEPRDVELGRLLRSMDLRRILSDRVALCIDTPPGPCRVRIDPAHMEEVVLQLVRNADTAVGGRGTIRIGLDLLPGRSEGPGPGGEWIQMEVADTGSGMTDAVLARAFEPFFTTRGSARGVAEGLGLPMVYGILRRAGGTVSIESTVGEGTVVRVQLPRV